MGQYAHGQVLPPRKVVFCEGVRAPSPIHGSIGHHECRSSTTSRSVWPFLQGSRSRLTDRQTKLQTDHATCVTMGRMYCYMMAMRPRSLKDSVQLRIACMSMELFAAGHDRNALRSASTVEIELKNIQILYLPIRQLGRRCHRSFPKSQSQDGGLPELLLA